MHKHYKVLNFNIILIVLHIQTSNSFQQLYGFSIELSRNIMVNSIEQYNYLAPEMFGDSFTGKCGYRRHRQIVAVAHAIELDVLGYVFRESRYVTRFSGDTHYYGVGDVVRFILVYKENDKYNINL